MSVRVQTDKAHQLSSKPKRIPAPGEAELKKDDLENRAEAKELAAMNRERSQAIRNATPILVQIRKTGKFPTHDDRLAELKRRDRRVYRAYIAATTNPKRKEN